GRAPDPGPGGVPGPEGSAVDTGAEAGSPPGRGGLVTRWSPPRLVRVAGHRGPVGPRRWPARAWSRRRPPWSGPDRPAWPGRRSRPAPRPAGRAGSVPDRLGRRRPTAGRG